jgi:CheY-like chemotaxis protein
MSAERRALVVDDDAGIRILVSRILTRHGYNVDAVKDGAEAIERLLQHDYAVITLDLMMPRIDGAAVVRYLVEHRPEMLPRVIVMTAFGDKAIRTVCPPVVRFIEKPFDISRLLAEAKECVGGAEPSSAPEPESQRTDQRA